MELLTIGHSYGINEETHELTIFMPESEYGIPEGHHEVVPLLRKYKDDPEIVHFIADMLDMGSHFS